MSSAFLKQALLSNQPFFILATKDCLAESVAHIVRCLQTLLLVIMHQLDRSNCDFQISSFFFNTLYYWTFEISILSALKKFSQHFFLYPMSLFLCLAMFPLQIVTNWIFLKGSHIYGFFQSFKENYGVTK